MRKVVGVLAGAAIVAVLGALWLLPRRGPSISEQLASLQANGGWIPIEERCRGHVMAPNDLTLWSSALAGAQARVPFDEADLSEALLALEQAPLEAWRAKDWALDPVSWTAEAEYLARRADELAEVADVFRTVGAYARLEACSLYAGLVPPEHFAGLERMNPFEGLRAVQFSLVRAACEGDPERVQRDLEALLACVERLRCPVNVMHFDLWALFLGRTLLALEGALPLVGERLDAHAWNKRLVALQPRELLLAALELERAAGLRSFEWVETSSSSLAFSTWDQDRDLASWLQGIGLVQTYLRGEDGAEQELESFMQGLLDAKLTVPLTLMLMPMFRDQEQCARSAEARLGLAMTGLRLARRGDARWEDVPRGLDPWKGATLDVQELPGGVLRLSAVRPGAEDDERRASEWLVR